LLLYSPSKVDFRIKDASYLLKTLQAFQAQGITAYSLSIQVRDAHERHANDYER
jgi:hypothetical protein